MHKFSMFLAFGPEKGVGGGADEEAAPVETTPRSETTRR
jgi:hypothetical protein